MREKQERNSGDHHSQTVKQIDSAFENVVDRIEIEIEMARDLQ